jgi:hypothetical protein
MRLILLALVVCSTTARAGTDTRDCETSDRRIVMSAGNGSNRVQIKYVDKARHAGVHDVPVKIMPAYGYNTEDSEDAITAVPISSEKFVSKNHQTLHVKHKDGTICDGRGSWDDRSVLRYVLMARDGQSLRSALEDKTVKGMTTESYIVAEFRCHTYGVSSPGGCFVGEGDETDWRDDP